MARIISIKEALASQSDEATLRAVINALAQEYLFIEQPDYCIEVNTLDYDAVTQSIAEIKRDIELNARR